MYKRGHEGMALLVLAPITGAFGAIGVLMTVCAFATCRLPDLDTRFGWLEHRGWTHTVWFGMLVGAIAGVVVFILTESVLGRQAWMVAVLAALAVYLGVFSHLVADALTLGRGEYAIRPFYPLSTHPLRFGVFRSDSRFWNAVLFGAGLLTQLVGLGTWYGASPF